MRTKAGVWFLRAAFYISLVVWFDAILNLVGDGSEFVLKLTM